MLKTTRMVSKPTPDHSESIGGEKMSADLRGIGDWVIIPRGEEVCLVQKAARDRRRKGRRQRKEKNGTWFSSEN